MSWTDEQVQDHVNEMAGLAWAQGWDAAMSYVSAQLVIYGWGNAAEVALSDLLGRPRHERNPYWEDA